MGYCYEKGWLSDYYFEKVIEVRENKVEDWTNEDLPGAGEKGKMLVLWGGVLNGELRIEPVHSMYTTATLPRETGPYTLEGITSGGDVEFSLSFTAGRGRGRQQVLPLHHPHRGGLGGHAGTDCARQGPRGR